MTADHLARITSRYVSRTRWPRRRFGWCAMAAFDPQIARLATITRSSLARAFEEKTQSLWNDGVQQELRSWLSLGVTLDFYPSDPQHLETLTHVFGVRWDVDEFGDLFDEGSTVDKHRLHP